MGTDIHLYVEQRQTDGTWKRVKPGTWKCSWCDGKCTIESGPYHKTPGVQIPCVNCEGKGTVNGEYDDRNYSLFAILANVRNGYGFAGVDTGDGFVPISEPRGLPDDLSFPREPDWSDDDAADNEPFLGDHSFSWVSLAEVLFYDYDRVTKKRGVVDSATYNEWREKGRGRPSEYCGGISGPNVHHVSHEEMQRLIMEGKAPTVKPPPPPSMSEEDRVAAMHELAEALGGRAKPPTTLPPPSYYTSVEWEETYREAVGSGWFSFMDVCKQLGDPERVRFVFGFDS